VTRVLLAGASPELAIRLSVLHPDLLMVPGDVLPTDVYELYQQLGGRFPDVVVLGPDALLADALALAARIDAEWPATSVVLAATPSEQTWPAVMRAGIRDVVAPDADEAELRAAIGRAVQAAAARRRDPAHVPSSPAVPQAPPARGRVIAVVSPKGGVGKTTVAANLAVGLAAAAPQSTVLVDLDVQFGDCATALGLSPEYTLPDVLSGPASQDSMVLKTFLTQHPTGLLAICGSESPVAGDRIAGSDVTRLLAALAELFQFVVVDTAPGLSEVTLAALEQATDAVLLSSMDVAGVRGLRRELDVLAELRLIPPARHVVLNFGERRRGVALPDVATALGTAVDVVIPRSATVPASSDEGVPLLQRSSKREPAAKEMRRLLDRVQAAPQPAPVMPPAKNFVAHPALPPAASVPSGVA
jgi:pilus assembly protein CpaE